jgi:hypothetical protein
MQRMLEQPAALRRARDSAAESSSALHCADLTRARP